MIRTEIIQKVRKKGDWTFNWQEIHGFFWGNNIEQGIEQWANENMMYAIITHEESPNESTIKEVTFVASR